MCSPYMTEFFQNICKMSGRRNKEFEDFLKIRRNCDRFDSLYKIIIIGDASIGKTGILRRFTENILPGDSQTTLGVDFKVRNVFLEGVGIKLQIWDTAGSERYRTMTAAFYRGSHGLLVAYDITREETFENAKKWIEHFQQESGMDLTNLPIMLLGNKLDRQEDRQVSRSKAERYAIKNGLRVKEVSALTGENIEEAFFELAQDIKRRRDYQEKHGSSNRLSTVQVERREKNLLKSKSRWSSRTSASRWSSRTSASRCSSGTSKAQCSIL